MIPARIVKQYAAYGREESFTPASDRPLLRILDACSASQQKSLQGLDNITSAGADAFDNLVGVVQALGEDAAGESWTKHKIKALKIAEYLKTDYKLHISRNECCTDHYTVHALSDLMAILTFTESVTIITQPTVKDVMPWKM